LNRFIRLTALTAALVAGLPAAADAHVTLQPAEVPAGAFTRLDVRVPNERDDARTTKVEVKLPAGLIFAAYEPAPGWSAEIKMAKLEKPVEVFGERHSELVDTVAFTTEGAGIGPARFRDFGLSVRMPEKRRSPLTFKTLQTYSNGEVVRWIGAPDAEHPAPRVKLAAAAREGGAAADGSAAAAIAAPTTGDDGGSDTLSVIALVVGALGLIAGLVGLVAARRSRSTSASEEARVAV
jgi:uncharacterized protein YcnI